MISEMDSNMEEMNEAPVDLAQAPPSSESLPSSASQDHDAGQQHDEEHIDLAPSSPPPLAVQELPAKPAISGGFSSWTRGFRLSTAAAAESAQQAQAETPRSALSLLTGGFGKRAVAKTRAPQAPAAENKIQAGQATEGALGSFTKGFLDTSRNAVKVVQIKARHMVSQNKRRYQEGTFDLDMSYITENIIAMGFPAGDISSGFLGYVEGLYRNHMEDVVQFFETHHKGKYKVYNLCSERLYDAALFQGKVACFPFNDHNCPPLHLIGAFCQSAYSWLKGDLENVVVVHCKAGKARTGLMISSLLLYLKFFPTAEESIQYYNQKRCVDGKGLILPSQVRYVKYFEQILHKSNGETPAGRKCILRGIRLHKCPYWIRPSITISNHDGVLFSSKKHPRTKELMPEDFWFNALRRGVVVFALPGERCVADLMGDFKIHFQDRHGDFYCWLNTNMMENRLILSCEDLDGFDKRKLHSPGFQVEVVILDLDAPLPTRRPAQTVPQVAANPPSAGDQGQAGSDGNTGVDAANDVRADDIFTDSEGEEGNSKRASQKSSRKSPDKEGVRQEVPERNAEPESENANGATSTSFGPFSNAFSSMMNAMDRVRVAPVSWAGVGASAKSNSSRPESALQPEAAPTQSGAQATEAASQEVDTLHGSSKSAEGFRTLEHPNQASGPLRNDPASGEREVISKAEDKNGQGQEVEIDTDSKVDQETSEVDDIIAVSDFKAIAAADPSLFSFGDDEEDYDSEEV